MTLFKGSSSISRDESLITGGRYSGAAAAAAAAVHTPRLPRQPLAVTGEGEAAELMTVHRPEKSVMRGHAGATDLRRAAVSVPGGDAGCEGVLPLVRLG